MKIEKKSGSLIVSLSGEIDDHRTADIKYTADEKFEDSELKNMIFDFSKVDFMDSAGIGLLLGRYKLVKKAGGNMAVVGVSGSIDRIMDLSGIYKLIGRYETITDALKALSKKQGD